MNVTEVVIPVWGVGCGFFDVPGFVVYTELGSVLYWAVFIMVTSRYSDVYRRRL